jgi:hypothetical protein
MAKPTKVAERNVDVRAPRKSRQSVRGLLEQTAVLAGRAVGIGARTAGRAAAAVGLSRDQHRDGQRSATIVEHVTNSLNQAVASVTETASKVADSTSPRHVTRPGRRAARRSTQTAKLAAAGQSTRKATLKVKSTGKRSKKSSPKRRMR